MIFMLICTEGNVSEPEFLTALKSAIGSQAPTNISMNIQVLPLPLGGNHGHVRLIETANRIVEAYSADSLVGLAGEGDVIEKWILVDHDNMESRKVNEEQLREDARNAGYTLLISKPRFEFFVLASLSDLETAIATKEDQIENKINECIASLNERDTAEKGFSKDMLMPPKYSKKKYVAEKMFGLMLNHHPELIEKMTALEVDTSAEKYSEIPVAVQRIVELYNG